jgi:hypothetical protein
MDIVILVVVVRESKTEKQSITKPLASLVVTFSPGGIPNRVGQFGRVL